MVIRGYSEHKRNENLNAEILNVVIDEVLLLPSFPCVLVLDQAAGSARHGVGLRSRP